MTIAVRPNSEGQFSGNSTQKDPPNNIDIGDLRMPIRRCSGRLLCCRFSMSDVYIGRTLLFLIYINDLPDCITSSTVRLFADDTALYHRISSPANTADLRHDLDALQAWECKWLMEFNPSKCQTLGLRLSTSQLRHLTWFMVIHLNWLSLPSTSVWPMTPNWISITTSILSLRKQMALELCEP